MILRVILALAAALAVAPAADRDPPIPWNRPIPDHMLLHKVEPVYPPLALAYRIQGTARFTVIIGEDGRVEDVRLVSGHPLLAPAARDLVRQWIYKPFLIGGEPVRIVTQVSVPFRIGSGGVPPPERRPTPEDRKRI